MDYAEKKRTGATLQFFLEPCDSCLDAYFLLGPTDRSVKALERIRKDFDNIGLVMDTAHVAEEGEDFIQAMEMAQDCCNRIHFANCQISDPQAEFYGDKHIGFDYPGSVFTYSEYKRIYDAMENMYSGKELTITLEVLCRQEDAFVHFEKIMEGMPWFFGKQSGVNG